MSKKPENDEEEEVSAARPNKQEYSDTIIPDHTGTTIIAFYHERGESRIENLPVIAWEVNWNGSKPISVEDIETPTICLKLSTGLFLFPGDTSFETEEKALEYGKARARSNYESHK